MNNLFFFTLFLGFILLILLTDLLLIGRKSLTVSFREAGMLSTVWILPGYKSGYSLYFIMMVLSVSIIVPVIFRIKKKKVLKNCFLSTSFLIHLGIQIFLGLFNTIPVPGNRRNFPRS